MFLDDVNGDPKGLEYYGNKFRVSSMPYALDIAEGNVPGHDPVAVFGHNEAVGSAFETIRSTGTPLVYLTSDETLQVKSSSVEDDAGGSGALTVLLTGCDSNYAAVSETVTLNGQTYVPTVAQFFRVWHAIALTGASNAGTITIENNAKDNELLRIDALDGQSHSATYTVLAGKTFYATAWSGGEVKAKESSIAVFSSEEAGPWINRREVLLKSYRFNEPLPFALRFVEKTDVELRALAEQGSGRCSASLDGWIEE